MIWLALSSAMVGLVHSLAPGHWIPIVMISKSRKWSLSKSLLGALTAASGHIFISILFMILSLEIGVHVLVKNEALIERYSGVGLIVFGIIYAFFSFNRHSHCHGHTHHGPEVSPKRGPFLFLFTLGLTPCVAALPMFIAAAPFGWPAMVATVISFAIGVTIAMAGATFLTSLGLLKLDHPVFEHYGDVITGSLVAALGVGLVIWGAH